MTVLHWKISIFCFHLLSKVFMNFSCTQAYQNWEKIKRVIFPNFCQICQSTNFYSYPLSKVSSSNYLIGSLKKIGCLGQSQIALWVERGSITGAVFGMTVLHQNMTNDRAPPKFKKWPCSTEKSQFLIYLLSKVFMNFSCIQVYHNWRKIKHVMWVRKFHVPGSLKFCQICQSTNFYFLSAF